MAEFNQFGSVRASQTADPKQCARFEAMLAEAVDGTLSPEDEAAFDLHMVGCATCQEMLAEAKRGAAWMEMLRQHTPEPPAAMLDRILAQTSGAPVEIRVGPAMDALGGLTGAGANGIDPGMGPIAASNILPFRKRAVRGIDFRSIGHTLLQPRLAMTAAMAFFSVALTLNLTGVHLSELRISDLKPSSLKRSMYEANAHVARYYTNLRVVYELESRVHDLQRSSDDDTRTAPAKVPQSKDTTAEPDKTDPGAKGKKGTSELRQRTSPGTSRREPIRADQRVLAEVRDEISPIPNARQTELRYFDGSSGLKERGTV